MTDTIKLLRTLAFVAIALIATLINYPLARFPGQDIMFNDQLLLTRVAWLRSAILDNPWASIDFLQGLGANFRSDVKVLPHFFDPAVLFSLIVDPKFALVLRNLALIVYCLWCLDLLWKQYYRQDNTSKFAGLEIPILLSYVLAPQFLYEVGHHFSAIFYTFPGLILATQRYLGAQSTRTALTLTIATTLFVSLSDLHIVFFIPTIGIFLFLFDEKFRKAKHIPMLLVIIAIGTITLLSYLAPLRAVLFKDPEVITSTSAGWTLKLYWSEFIKRIGQTMLFPKFHGPIALFAMPYLFLFGTLFLVRPLEKNLKKALKLLLALTIGLVLFGIVLHAVPFIRAKLPSAMRYHLVALPYLVAVFCIFHIEPITKHLNTVLNTFRPKKILLACILISLVITLRAVDSAQDPHLIFSELHLSFPKWLGRALAVLTLTVYPILFLLSGLKKTCINLHTAKGLILTVACSLAVGSTYYIGRSLGLAKNSFAFISFPFYSTLYEQVPADLNRIIDRSPYASASRSYMTIAEARDSSNPNRGRNDKISQLIEYSEAIHGRIFFQWRYSYSKHTSRLYDDTTKEGPTNYFPPGAPLIDNTIALAELTQSPLLISADAKYDRPDIEELGHIKINSIYSSDFLSKYNDGLVGTIYVYGIKSLAPEKLKNLPHATYSRTSVEIGNLPTNANSIRIPISFFADLVAFDQNRRSLTVEKSNDGFAVVKVDSAVNKIRLTSFSGLSIATALAPLLGFLILILPLISPADRSLIKNNSNLR